MRLSAKQYRGEVQRGAAALVALGVDLAQQGTYDCKPTGKRYSVFRGRISAVWCDSHFRKIPFGTFRVLG